MRTMPRDLKIARYLHLLTSGAVIAITMLVAASATAKPDEKIQQARQHYEAGLASFNLQEYAKAIEEFEAGYRLRPDPVFLYNLGQEHRLAEKPERALYFYRAFLRSSSNAPNRKEVEERIASLDALVAQKRNAATPPYSTLPPQEKPAVVEQPAPVAQPVVVAKAGDRPTPVYRRWWLWTAVGVVAVGLGVGLGVGLTAGKSSNGPTLGTVGPGALTVRF